MYTRIWYKVGLKLIQIDIQSAIKPETRSDRANNLRHQAVQMLESRTWNIQITAAYVVHGFIIHEKGAIRVLDGTMCRQDSVVWFDNSRRDERCRIYGELKLGFFPVVRREPLEKQSTKTRARPTSKRVEDEESLKRRTIVYPKN